MERSSETQECDHFSPRDRAKERFIIDADLNNKESFDGTKSVSPGGRQNHPQSSKQLVRVGARIGQPDSSGPQGREGRGVGFSIKVSGCQCEGSRVATLGSLRNFGDTVSRYS